MDYSRKNQREGIEFPGVFSISEKIRCGEIPGVNKKKEWKEMG